MLVKKTNINEVLLISPEIYFDNRGHFYESFNEDLQNKLKYKFVQCNESFSKYGVLRGIHFQKSPY